MPLPAETMPFRILPLLGTISPIIDDDPTPSEAPVAGLMATRFALEHGFWPGTAQPGVNSSGAWLACQRFGKKFDICSLESYCGPLWTNLRPMSSVSFLLIFQLS